MMALAWFGSKVFKKTVSYLHVSVNVLPHHVCFICLSEFVGKSGRELFLPHFAVACKPSSCSYGRSLEKLRLKSLVTLYWRFTWQWSQPHIQKDLAEKCKFSDDQLQFIFAQVRYSLFTKVLQRDGFRLILFILIQSFLWDKRFIGHLSG